MNSVRRLKQHSGQAVIEFALIAPILILLILGAIDIIMIIYNNVLIANTGREAMRLVSVGSDINSISNKIAISLEPAIGKATVTIIETNDKNNQPSTKIILNSAKGTNAEAYIVPTYRSSLISGTEVSVSIYYRYKYFSPIRFFMGSDFLVQSRSSSRLESPPK